MAELIRRAQWQIDLLRRAVWTRLEFLCALCGRDLDPDERDAERKRATGDPYASEAGLPEQWDDEQWRAHEAVDAAVEAGEFDTYRQRNTTTGDYRIERDEAIRWAAARLDLFPRFPFTEADLPARETVEDDGVIVRFAPTIAELTTPRAMAPAGVPVESIVEPSESIKGAEAQSKWNPRKKKLLDDYKAATGIKSTKRVFEEAGVASSDFYKWLNDELKPGKTADDIDAFLIAKKTRK